MPTARKEAAIGELTEKLAARAEPLSDRLPGFDRRRDHASCAASSVRTATPTAVVKNTLFRIAAGDLAGQLESFLAGPTGIVFAGVDPVAPAKALKTFSDTVKKVAVKAAYIDGRVVDAKQVEILAKLPPKLELMAKPRRYARQSAARARDRALRKSERSRARAQRDCASKKPPHHRITLN